MGSSRDICNDNIFGQGTDYQAEVKKDAGMVVGSIRQLLKADVWRCCQGWDVWRPPRSNLLTGARFWYAFVRWWLYTWRGRIQPSSKKKLMVHNKTGISKSDEPREFSTGPPIAISLLRCSRMSVSLFYTLMMEVKDVGEIIDRIWIQTQCDFGYVETFLLWLGDASAFLRWLFGSGWWKCQPVFLHWPHGWKFAGVNRANF